ncbi:MAG: anti-sigma factor [Acidobacteriota bacterium]
MKYERSKEEKQEQAALFALGALGQHESRVFEETLADGDPQLEAELKTFDKVVEALGYSVDPVEPPQFILDVLQMRIEKEPQLAKANTLTFPEPSLISPPPVPVAFPQPAVELKPKMVVEKATVKPDNVVSIEQKKSGRSSAFRFIPWAIAAGLLIFVSLVFIKYRDEQTITSGLRSQLEILIDQNNKIRDDIRAKDEKVYELARINEVIQSEGHRRINLEGQPPAPNSQALIHWDVKTNQWLVSADLPPAPEGKVYQLWFVTPDAKISAGLLKPNHTGHAFTEIPLPADLTNLAAAAITLEPEGGSAQPTMPIFVLGKI